jgi:hypothetical protein
MGPRVSIVRGRRLTDGDDAPIAAANEDHRLRLDCLVEYQAIRECRPN